MAGEARDGNRRWRYTSEFRRQQIERITRGGISAAELSRELDFARSLIQRWNHLGTRGSETAVQANITRAAHLGDGCGSRWDVWHPTSSLWRRPRAGIAWWTEQCCRTRSEHGLSTDG